MCQFKKEKHSQRALFSALFVGGTLLMAAPVYAAAPDDTSGRTVDSSLSVLQNGRTVTGVVKDSAGEPIIGANVKVKGTSKGTITDLDGNFSLNGIAPDAVLVVSYIGYKETEVRVGDRTSLSVQLVEDSKVIDEVVVVGYATQKKVNLTGSVSSINMSEIAEKRPITNLSSGLAGMASGVSFRTSSNIPGNESASILIRGQGTLNNSAPLVVVDGVESDIANVNPQDVESMSVLKDAASSSIYGSRAANGVILITTKKGKEGKINIDYTGYASLESVGKTVDAVSNYADYMELRNEARQNSGDSPQFEQSVIDAWRNDAGRNPLIYPNTDWVDEVFKTAVATNHNLSLSGGTDKLSFYTSFGYSNNPGIMENSGYERYSFRSNVEAKPTKWLTLGMKLNGYLSNNDIGSDWVDDLFTYGYASTPGIVLRAPDGRFGGPQAVGEDIQTNNPLQQLYSRTGNKKNRNLRAAFNGTITPLKGLSISGSYSYELTDKDNWEKPNQMALWNFATDQEVRQTYTGKTYVYNYNRKIERMFMDLVVRYNNKFFNDKFDLNVMAGASQEMRRDRSFSATKYDWIDSSVDVINGATGDATASGSHTEWAMRSYFGRINLAWADRYLLEANLRADASSRFLDGNRWGYFPSFSAGWRVDQEAFMESTRNWLDALKLRVSWGELGNNYLSSDYQAISKYAATNYSFGGQMQTGMTITALANGALTWESTAVTNAAVDFTMLNSRLSGTVEYFYKKTSDILIDLPAPLVHGNASIPTQNSAEVTNKGFELSLNWADNINDFHYNIGTNITFVDNKVTKFKGDEPSINGSTMIKEGYPINVQYCLVADRIIQTQEDLDYVQSLVDNAPLGEDGKKVNPFQTYQRPELGDVLYKDMDGNGIFNDDDRVPMGHGDTPRFFYDINLGCSWKGLDFSMLMSGTGSYKVQYQSMHTTNMPASGYQIGQEIADGRWYEGRTTPAKYPRLLSNDGRNTRNSTLWLTDRKFLKIRNVQLGYTLPAKWVKAASLSRVRVFCSLENFFTFSDFVGMDPENTQNLAYPNIRQASFGVNVSF
ncbi:TonB-dependent receptor [Bacteroides sp. ET225]|uniref:SusC/RagA family TonB-linked outer membrane protein n=1 Tax=Bacteroides sp. ET225 TaxID=2972461 RepID=UPI0021AD3E9D|nr:TonB-dependent receptor [Bacteroides sp. ET225]MCR8918006.1 TonB-dependent receptor [Bacteroides sp. ET225]